MQGSQTQSDAFLHAVRTRRNRFACVSFGAPTGECRFRSFYGVRDAMESSCVADQRAARDPCGQRVVLRQVADSSLQLRLVWAYGFAGEDDRALTRIGIAGDHLEECRL